MTHLELQKLEVLKSDGKNYYVMNIKKQWYALALEDFQVTFLQQYISPKAFNIKVDSNKLKTAIKPLTVYDFTSLDDDELIHMFFDRQRPYKEPIYEVEPSHLKEKPTDDRTLQNNEEFARMSPYNFKKEKTDDSVYYIMKINNILHAIALELHQVKLLKVNSNLKVFNYPINAEALAEIDKKIITYNFTNSDDKVLFNFFRITPKKIK